MQLLLVLAVLLMLGGKGDGARPQITNSEMFEVLKYVSGDNGEMDKIIKEAEQVSQIISAFAPLATAFGGDNAESDSASAPACDEAQKHDKGFYLQPVANIADDGIYNALSNAI